ncbi:MAG: hypothetical protein IJ437_00960 [Clostridia bacterium]|nr:hypothetical protein [Clostridia bacterium]
MNKKIKLLILAGAIFLMCLFVASCSESDVYDEYNEDGYKVTIRYDANGGFFGNAGQLYVNDTYNIGKVRINENGMKEIKLVDLNDPSRGKANMYPLDTASNTGYFHAGWYTEKTAMTDENGKAIKDDLGNVVYSYSGKIEFPQIIEIDPTKKYSADEPAITVYAAWVRCPRVEVYEKVKGVDTLIGTYEITKPLSTNGNKIIMPEIDSETGYLKFNTLAAVSDWQEREVVDTVAMTENGSTTIKVTKYFDGFYIDSARQNKASGTYTFPFVYDSETATIQNDTLKLYTKYEEKIGEWFKIYTASQLDDNASADGNYEIMADLEFTERITWPNAFKNNEFTGVIKGNGHTISNIQIKSTNGQYFAMFGGISEDAVIENITFDNVSATIDKTYRYPGGRYALFAAVIARDEDGARKPFKNVSLTNATLNICASSYAIETQDYEVALLCAEGYGEDLGIDISDISYNVIAEEYDIHNLIITKDADGNKLILVFEQKETE